jgi:predicted DNA-binding mobile mystery protein A
MRGRSWDKALRREQLDRALQAWRTAAGQARPKRGWIRELREALGMSARQLAERMRVTQPSVADFERREAQGTITLASLERAAEALGCRFVYAFVPDESLETMVRARAERVAARIVDGVEHTMRLEDQATTGVRERRIAEEADLLVRTRLGELWDEPA